MKGLISPLKLTCFYLKSDKLKFHHTLSDLNMLHSGKPFRVCPEEFGHSTKWFPSLETLARNTLKKAVARGVSKVDERKLDGDIWTMESFKSLKSYLHDLPFKMLEEICDEIFHSGDEAISFQNTCPNCSRFSALQTTWKCSLSSQEFHFLSWWLFFDESRSRTIIKHLRLCEDQLKRYLETTRDQCC